MQTFVNIPPVFHHGVFNPLGMADVLAEPSLFSCSSLMVNQVGGPLTRSALNQIEQFYPKQIEVAKKAGLTPIIDVRVHRLMPGQYPAIPGWHCDAVPRNNYHGQPDFSMVDPAAFHVCLLLSNEKQGVSNTEFVDSVIKPKMWDDEHVYRDLHREVERIKPDIVELPDGVFAWFNQRSIHRASPCHRRGVRMFMRYSMYHKPPIQNKVQGQQQVYQLAEANGW